jgi:general secretion pathway protein K
VRGMTGALFRALQPHLTLFGPADPNATAADPVVAAALVLSGALSSAGVAAPPPANPNASSEIIARIHAAAEGPGNARVRRMAIIRIGGREPAGYRPLAWGNDDD